MSERYRIDVNPGPVAGDAGSYDVSGIRFNIHLPDSVHSMEILTPEGAPTFDTEEEALAFYRAQGERYVEENYDNMVAAAKNNAVYGHSAFADDPQELLKKQLEED